MNYPPIVSDNVRIRVPDGFVVGEGSIVDDYSYFSTRIHVGRFCHLAHGISVGGGRERTFTLGDFSSVSTGTRIWCASADFVSDMVALYPPQFHVQDHMISGDVTMETLTVVGANSVLMPDNHVPEGVAIGALSFVPPGFEFEPWTVYAGIPVRPICPRDRSSVMRQRDALLQQYDRLSSDHP